MHKITTNLDNVAEVDQSTHAFLQICIVKSTLIVSSSLIATNEYQCHQANHRTSTNRTYLQGLVILRDVRVGNIANINLILFQKLFQLFRS